MLIFAEKSTAVARPSKFWYFPNVDFAGNDIVRLDLGLNDCIKACDSNPQCVAFASADKTSVQRADYCWLKTKAGPAFGENPVGYVNGAIIPRKRVYKVSSVVDNPGNDILFYSKGDAASCTALCELYPNCIAFALKRSGPGCWIKHTLSATTANGEVDMYYAQA